MARVAPAQRGGESRISSGSSTAACPANGQLWNGKCRGCPSYRVPRRCALATPLPVNSSSMSTASSSTPSTKRESIILLLPGGSAAATEIHRALEQNLGAAGRDWEVRGVAPPIYTFQDHGVGGSRSAAGDAEQFKLQARERWRQLRDRMHATICERGIRRQPQHLHADFRQQRARCKSVARCRSLASCRRTIRASHRGNREVGQRLRAALPKPKPALMVFPRERAYFFRAASGLPTTTRCRTETRSIRPVRAPAIALQRRRPARGRIRSSCAAAGR